MPTYTLTGNVANLVGDFDLTRSALAEVQGYVESAVPVVNDPVANQQRYGNKPLSFSASGTWSVDLIGTGPLVPAYRVHIFYNDGSANSRLIQHSSNWFELTSNTEFGSVVQVPLTPVDTETLQSVYEARDEAETNRLAAEQARDEAVDISGIDTSDDVVEALVKPGSAGPKTKAALAATFALVGANPLNAVQASYLDPSLPVSVDQSANLQDFIDAVAAQNGGLGGCGYIPSGIYGMGNASGIKFPESAVVDIWGDAGGGYPFQGGTVLQWTGDVAAPPDTQFGIQLGQSPYLHRITDINGIGPRTFSGGAGGRRPAALGFLNILSSAVVRSCGDQGGFSSTYGLGGPGKYADHITIEGKLVSGSGYAINWLPGSISGGDFRLRGQFVFDNSLASIGIAGSAGGFGGSSCIGGGFYGPVGILGYDDGSANGSNFVDTVSFTDVNFETNAHAAILDLTYSRFIRSCDFNSTPYNVPSAGLAAAKTWSQSCPVTAASGSTLTVTDSMGGFVFHKNMTVTGTGIPAGTVITAVAGSWPSTSYMLTLSQAPSSSAVGQNATISMPTVATFVAQAVMNNEWRGELTGRPGFPFIAGYYVGANRVRDGGKALAKVLQGDRLMTVTPDRVEYAIDPAAPVDRWGEGGPHGCLILTGQGSYSFLVSQYDVVEMAPGNDLTKRGVRPATGGMPVVGIAMQTSIRFSPGPLDIVARATSGQGVPVKNKSGAMTPAGLVKVDAANPGGITAASAMSDGPAIGYTNADIAAGATGTLAAFWGHL